MKNNWRKITLGDAIELKRGYDLPSNDREVGLIPIVSSSGITDYHSVAKVKGPGVVTGRYGTIGEVFYLKEDFWPLNTTLYVKDFKGNDPRFFSYFLLCLGIKELNAAGAVPGVNRNHLHKIKISLPSPPTQRKIAAILSAYDDLIENNLKRIKLLEEKAQLTYEEWFVRMKFPGHKSTPINEETGLPEGWEQKALGDIIEITSSKRIFLADYVEEGIPFYRGKEIILKSKNEALNDRLYISKERFKEIKEKFGSPKKGDLLITAVGTLGFPYLVTESDGDFYFKDGNLIWFKGNKKISSTYLISCFKNDQFKLNLHNIAIGSSQKALTIQSLKGLKIINPEKKISSKFDSMIAQILDAIESLQNQNQLLKEARDILLPRLMTGMIDVEELDLSAFEEVTINLL